MKDTELSLAIEMVKRGTSARELAAALSISKSRAAYLIRDIEAAGIQSKAKPNAPETAPSPKLEPVPGADHPTAFWPPANTIGGLPEPRDLDQWARQHAPREAAGTDDEYEAQLRERIREAAARGDTETESKLALVLKRFTTTRPGSTVETDTEVVFQRLSNPELEMLDALLRKAQEEHLEPKHVAALSHANELFRAGPAPEELPLYRSRCYHCGSIQRDGHGDRLESAAEFLRVNGWEVVKPS